MSGENVVLDFGLVPDRYADAVIAAEALIDWVRLAKEAARAIDPASDLSVKLLGRSEGSLRNLLRLAETVTSDISKGADEYPTLKVMAIALAGSVIGGGIQSGFQLVTQPSAQVVQLSATDRALLEKMQGKVQASSSVSAASQRFYKTIERDPAIANIAIAKDSGSPPIIVIPRSEFPERGGLWALQEVPPPEAMRYATWNVVLLRASFTHKPVAWRFSRDGLPFSARMDDPDFLAAIAAETVPITLKEGVLMQIEVEYKERLVGQAWEYVDGTRKVLKVISPRPLPVPAIASPSPPE